MIIASVNLLNMEIKTETVAYMVKAKERTYVNGKCFKAVVY